MHSPCATRPYVGGRRGSGPNPPTPPPLEYPNLFIQFTVNVPKTGLGPFDKYTCNYLTYAPPPPGEKFLDPRSRLFCVKFGIREEEKNVSKLRYIQYTNQTVTKVHLCILLGRTIIDSPNIYLKYNVSLL